MIYKKLLSAIIMLVVFSSCKTRTADNSTISENKADSENKMEIKVPDNGGDARFNSGKFQQIFALNAGFYKVVKDEKGGAITDGTDYYIITTDSVLMLNSKKGSVSTIAKFANRDDGFKIDMEGNLTWPFYGIQTKKVVLNEDNELNDNLKNMAKVVELAAQLQVKLFDSGIIIHNQIGPGPIDKYSFTDGQIKVLGYLIKNSEKLVKGYPDFAKAYVDKKPAKFNLKTIGIYPKDIRINLPKNEFKPTEQLIKDFEESNKIFDEYGEPEFNGVFAASLKVPPLLAADFDKYLKAFEQFLKK